MLHHISSLWVFWHVLARDRHCHCHDHVLANAVMHSVSVCIYNDINKYSMYIYMCVCVCLFSNIAVIHSSEG